MAESTALTVAQRRMVEVRDQLEKNRGGILRLLGGNEAEAERLVTSALIAVADDANLAACDPRSVCRAVLQAAMCGADLTAGRGDGWIIAFKGKATFMDGYALWRRKMAEAGYHIVADVVCEGDAFTYRKAPLTLEHTYDPFAERGKERGAYAAAYRIERGGERWLVDAEVVSVPTIEKARKQAKERNKGRESPAWREWFEQMAVRLPIKRVAKRLDLRTSEHAWRLLELERMHDSPGQYHPAIDTAASIEPQPAADLEPGRKRFGWAASPAPEVVPPAIDDGVPAWDEEPRG